MTVYTSVDEVQTAFYALLKPGGTLDATLSGLGLNAVYDFLNVPQNAPYDYLTLGDGYELPNNTMGVRGHRNGFYYYPTLHLWSMQRGTKNPSGMVSRVIELFDGIDLTLATLTHVETKYRRTLYQADPTNAIPYLHAAIQFFVNSVQS